MTNLIVFAIIAVIVGGAGLYIYRAKRRGVKCIGCPAGESCGGHACSGSCSACSGGCPHHRA